MESNERPRFGFVCVVSTFLVFLCLMFLLLPPLLALILCLLIVVLFAPVRQPTKLTSRRATK